MVVLSMTRDCRSPFLHPEANSQQPNPLYLHNQSIQDFFMKSIKSSPNPPVELVCDSFCFARIAASPPFFALVLFLTFEVVVEDVVEGFSRGILEGCGRRDEGLYLAGFVGRSIGKRVVLLQESQVYDIVLEALGVGNPIVSRFSSLSPCFPFFLFVLMYSMSNLPSQPTTMIVPHAPHEF